jgi:hypothetical protein
MKGLPKKMGFYIQNSRYIVQSRKIVNPRGSWIFPVSKRTGEHLPKFIIFIKQENFC